MENEKKSNKITREEFNQKVQEQLDDIKRIFEDYEQNHKNDEEERSEENR